ncbi:MAG: GSCFA domain-containing protein [Bacteroidales bacterium]|nr:GSCFA domain-containing protein [Bacteroidales bacterium]
MQQTLPKIPLQTTVSVDPAGLSLSLGRDRLLLLGSCFSDSMAEPLANAGFTLLANPFGTLYNPLSICRCLLRSLDGTPLADDDMVYHDGLHHSWLHHSRFSSPDRQRCAELCNDSIAAAHSFLQDASLVVLTFGTAYVFELKEGTGDTVVANCHKVPASRFVRRLATVDEMACALCSAIERLRAVNPTLKVLLTVSPIRHLADGAHGNQVSKATLHLLCNEMQRRCDCHYFPSYEIMMDELRDYRFYAADMLHPSPTAVEILWRRFVETYVPPVELPQIESNLRESRRLLHRPIASH